MSTAKALTERLAATGQRRRGPSAIYAVVSDEHNLIAMTEGMLDVWFLSLSPERKAEIYEADLDSDLAPTALPDLTISAPTQRGASRYADA